MQMSLEDNEMVTLKDLCSLPNLMELYFSNNKLENLQLQDLSQEKINDEKNIAVKIG